MQNHPKHIRIDDYSYELPESSIAIYPLENRDESKLLNYKKGDINHYHFRQLPELIANDSLMVLNNTKVFHARLIFSKPSGGMIEIFCLSPHDPIEHSNNFASKAFCTWHCYVGNAKKWKNGLLEVAFQVNNTTYTCQAEMIEKLSDSYLVKFSWNAPDLCFLDLTEILGKLPIPPYLERDAELIDELRYQTVFAEKTGSVAAPTASLHFTQNVFDELAQKNIGLCHLTLHVGAGTFKPVTAKTIEGHQMHHETIEVTIESLTQIAKALSSKKPIICVGTTSMRTIESIYWHALNVYHHPEKLGEIHIEQWTPYEKTVNITPLELIQNLIHKMSIAELKVIRGTTGILIAPGYSFVIVNALITNFHQPQSTLLLLIAAITGENWKLIYEAALKNQYRFLSYGDSSLLWIN